MLWIGCKWQVSGTATMNGEQACPFRSVRTLLDDILQPYGCYRYTVLLYQSTPCLCGGQAAWYSMNTDKSRGPWTNRPVEVGRRCTLYTVHIPWYIHPVLLRYSRDPPPPTVTEAAGTLVGRRGDGGIHVGSRPEQAFNQSQGIPR